MKIKSLRKLVDEAIRLLLFMLPLFIVTGDMKYYL